MKSHKREFQAAIDFFQKSEVLTIEIDSTYVLHGIYNNLGVTFHNMWQLDEALEYYLKALKLREALRNLILNNIGEIYYHKNDLEKSEKYYLKALEISRKIKDYRVLPNTLYCLIRNNVERRNSEKTKEYLDELELLNKKIGYELVEQYYLFAKVFVLKSSISMSDWIEAADILEEYLVQEKLPADWRIDELFALAEIRLKELKLTGDKNAILEVRKQIERLQKEAESKQYYWLLINLYWLKSQLALIELDARKAIQLLITAKTLAEEKNIGLLVEKINQEQKQLESQLTMWEKLKEQNPPILEVLKQVPIEETAKHIVKDTVMEVRDEKTGDVIEYRKLFALKI
ncbi:MAG: tetratricopeptide repeat protein [Asgard group archaeon]|nr:tetratricopeptide repeat protein [Asgard group archaeon]